MTNTCKHGVKITKICDQCNAEVEQFIPPKLPPVHLPGSREYMKAALKRLAQSREKQQADEKLAEPEIPEGYEELHRVLKGAFDQAAHGKGKRRHANDLAFQDQPIMKISSMVGLGGLAYQIIKKSQEAVGMNARGEYDAAIAEYRGAINYAAAAILLIEGKRDGSE